MTASTTVKRIAHSIPTLATLGVLAGVGYLGHQTEWKLPPVATVFGGAPPADEAWCRDHGVSEATCVTCRGYKVTAIPPSERLHAGKLTGAGQPPVQEPPVTEGKPRPIVQVPSAEALKLAGIETAPAESRALTESIAANAEAGYDMTRYAQVGPRAGGSVVIVRVQPGQRVAKGDVLALIDSPDVGKAKADLLRASALALSRSIALERIQASTSAGFRNQSELAAAEADVRDADIQLYTARQSMTNLGLAGAATQVTPTEQDLRFLGVPDDIAVALEPDQATANLLPVVSPLDGVVISQAVVPGEVVESARTLFVVSDTARMWVTAELPLSESGRVQLGQELRFLPDGWSAEPFMGRVSWVSTEVDDTTRTVRVRAEVANPDGRLLAHAFGRVTITIGSKPDALLVPEESIQSDGPVQLVFVRLNAEVFRPRVVTIGARVGGMVEVLSGLLPGDAVATRGSFILAAQANRAKLGAGCCANE